MTESVNYDGINTKHYYWNPKRFIGYVWKVAALTTVWKFSKFPTIQILREISFSWFQNVKNYQSSNCGGFELWFLGIFNIFNCELFQKPNFKASKIANSAVFDLLKSAQIDFTSNLNGRKFTKFPHCADFTILTDTCG